MVGADPRHDPWHYLDSMCRAYAFRRPGTGGNTGETHIWSGFAGFLFAGVFYPHVTGWLRLTIISPQDPCR